jgi:hypothetical protein
MARLSPSVLGKTGLQRFRANMGKERVTRMNQLRRGLLRGALVLQRESQKMVPVDTGNLKASAFTRYELLRGEPSYLIGYTASYALFVHEAIGMKLKGEKRQPYYIDGQKRGGKGRYWDPQGQSGPKFLEGPARTKRREIRAAVISEMKGIAL